MVPPIRLWDAGVPNEAALKIMTRNSRMPESLAADLDAECSACLMGARRMAELFERYGRDTVEACFDAILDKTTETFRREILVEDPGRGVRLGGLRRARRRRRAAAAHPADHADPHRRRTTPAASGWSSTSTAPPRRRRGRSTTAATTPTATS